VFVKVGKLHGLLQILTCNVYKRLNSLERTRLKSKPLRKLTLLGIFRVLLYIYWTDGGKIDFRYLWAFVECFLSFLCRWRNWLVMKQSLHTKQKGVRGVEIVYGLPEKKEWQRRASEVACVHDGREASAKP
jgi:hypothetical protein